MDRAAVMRLLSPYVGPIRALQELTTLPGHAPLPAFMAETADLRLIHGCPVRSIRGSATHYDRASAMAAAVGEAVERYCGAAMPETLPLAPAVALGTAAVSPDRFALFHPAQYARPEFPYRPFTPETCVRWTKGVDLSTHAAVYLPAQLVYLGAEAGAVAGDTPIGYATSNGMACGLSAEEAVLGGLLEVVERDAVMLTWYARWSPPILEWRADSSLATVEDRYFAVTGLRYTCLDLSDLHGIPTVLAVVRGTEVGMAVGAASALRPGEAWLKAMREAFATYAWADRLRRTTPPIALTRPDLVRRFADHVRFYADPQALPSAAFLWQSQESRDIRALPDLLEPVPVRQIAAVVGRIVAAGASVFAVDLTTVEVRRAGAHVWKVVSPELQPLDVGYERRYLGGPRLYAMAAQLTGRPLSSPEDVNPWPHPFP
ncbi:MAG: YcaO-like family protein [Armatimonadota bacterium]|nr:YcaO-like family protein [Armatimonadota bacterium]MDR7451300.1 YcaO-like family protein [Armatimonadota bacterium]MDR7466797.1 YcaO-like family protein [Armatimonadota bacterium]MDR7492730.1 YcaO-like family protein [Armatimonadota bacterium]MDR7498506.1 YcaO-like family protein [Armatimonadota bacterium]